jgi:pyruvate-formate lyase-activating enzyme
VLFRYKITQIPNSGEQALKSFLVLAKSKVKFEIRTTYDPRFITNDNMVNIAKFLTDNHVGKWIIQECILRYGNKANEKLALPSKDLIGQLIEIIDVEIRK